MRRGLGFGAGAGTSWLRRHARQARLAAAECRDWAKERQTLLGAFLLAQQRRHRALLAEFRATPSDRLEWLWFKARDANRSFDRRFNAGFDRAVESLQLKAKDLGPRLQDWLQRGPREASRLAQSLSGRQRPAPGSKVVKEKKPVAADAGVLALLGAGLGSALQGFFGPLYFLWTWALLRFGRRFVVQCIDAEDAQRLFRWAPPSLRRKQGELFQWLHHELHVMRRIRQGDLRYLGKKGQNWERGMRPENDHSPETLFDLAMQSLVKHPRVQEWVGETVRPKAEPDKVVHRIHEGVAEVFLGWYVKGELGEAEIQVKASGCLVDFIYVYPQGRDHYGLQPGGFVIRPNGDTWSQDTDQLPKDQKKPFGAYGGRLLRHREGIFHWDYEVGEFRHGYEGENHPRAQAYKRWFG
ncbi:unnamed protein product [Effrenium voratum]|nr:unnamed protein product [Effrenium voratum]